MKYKIKVEKNILEDIKLNGIENEFKHLILNLISNSKDAFEEKGIMDRKIEFALKKEGGYTVLEVTDNAGGIPENIINKIFDANFTSKTEGKGTGIGLYMSKQIVKKTPCPHRCKKTVTGGQNLL